MSQQSQHTVEMELYRNIELLRKRLRRTTGRMSQHINLLSRHNEELPEKKTFVTTKVFMLQHTIQVLTLQGMKEMSRQKTLMSRQVQDEFS